jgi:hypothetical protein
MKLDRRLHALGRQLGCSIHGEPLSCPACDPGPPLPEVVVQAEVRLVDAVCARLGTDTLRARLLPVPRPPTQDFCPKCATKRQCRTCQVSYSKRFIAAIGLTPDEHARLQEIMDLCHALEP